MENLADILKLPGMLTLQEARYLYRLAQLETGKGVIVEIGSWKGKSTACLARGSMAVGGPEVYAIDPHRPLAVEGYLEDTEREFRENIAVTRVESQVVSMAMTSEDAAQGWSRPIRLLWIDGDHGYEQVKKDFLLWEPHLIEGGVIAMHDTIRKKGPKRVVWEEIFRSTRFQDISVVDNITAARKVKRVSPSASVAKWFTIACRAVYIAARKIRVPYSKPAGRWILRQITT